MRALAISGTVTVALMPSISAGSLMRATPPSRRMSAGTRSSAMTAQAPASSAIFACSGVTTSMITPPLSIWARPFLVAHVDCSKLSPPEWVDVTKGECDHARATASPMDRATFDALGLDLDRRAPAPLHRQLYEQLRGAILSG